METELKRIIIEIEEALNFSKTSYDELDRVYPKLYLDFPQNQDGTISLVFLNRFDKKDAFNIILSTTELIINKGYVKEKRIKQLKDKLSRFRYKSFGVRKVDFNTIMSIILIRAAKSEDMMLNVANLTSLATFWLDN